MAAPSKYANCHRGYYKPRNPRKYIGDLNGIEFKSGLELAAFRQLDYHSSVIQWSVESVKVPYRFKGQSHHYVVDVWMKVLTRDGSYKEYLVEIKHTKNVKKPTYRKRRTKNFDNNLLEWERNQAKWKYANEYAKKRGMKFTLLTEEKIYGKGL